jgi:murein DD-endopeptidase MepM/ murein hydrolase activator NlpD
MDWIIAFMLLLQSLGSAADAQAKAHELAVQLEASYYEGEQALEAAMKDNITLIPSAASQGDAVLVRSETAGELVWREKKYPLTSLGAGYYAVLPVPTDLKAGKYTVQGPGQIQTTLTVTAKAFEVDRLTVTKEQESMWQNTDRINADQKKINLARSKSVPEVLFKEPFIKPVDGRLTTPYGYTRYVNGVFNSIHRAVDLAAPQGTPVKATNNGVVVLAEELYLTGNAIYIDHGMNIFSQYAHMSKLHVKTGDQVKIGDVIGEVGTTGFSTGPHMHFTFWIGNDATNPDRFFDSTPFRWQKP